jgi:hypothetical protein
VRGWGSRWIVTWKTASLCRTAERWAASGLRQGKINPGSKTLNRGSPRRIALAAAVAGGRAQYLLGPFDPTQTWRRWAKLAGRGRKNAKRAGGGMEVMVLLHRLWVHGEVYEPLYQSQRAAARSAQACSVPSGV